jgi:hypothetical protein
MSIIRASNMMLRGRALRPDATPRMRQDPAVALSGTPREAEKRC